jgi:hypothetical protein
LQQTFRDGRADIGMTVKILMLLLYSRNRTSCATRRVSDAIGMTTREADFPQAFHGLGRTAGVRFVCYT